MAAGNRLWGSLLPDAGFQLIDFALRVSLNGLQKAQLPKSRVQLRNAERNDAEAVDAIAGQAFEHGRYHADPGFPRSLADLRYRDWMKRAMSAPQAVDHVFVMGRPEAVQGFYHVTVEGKVADLRLAAVKLERQGTVLGFELYLAVLHHLRELGVERVVTTISAANTAVMNVYSSLGFRFSEPEAVYHWHSDEFLRQANQFQDP